MRLFVAVELPEDLKQTLGKLIQEIKKQNLFTGSFVLAQNLHLTLNFIGELPEGRLAELKLAIRKPLSTFKRFGLELAGLGAFPSKGRPRVLFVAAQELGDAKGRASEMHDMIKKNLVGLPHGYDHGYENHVTLARVGAASASGNKIKEFFEKHENMKFGSFDVSKIVLMKSTLAPKGPVYEVLERFGLRVAKLI